MTRLLFLLCAAAASCSSRPELPIVNWHAVSAQGDDFAVSETQLGEELDWIVAQGYRAVSLHELVEHRASGAPLPAKAIALTFDDGTADALIAVLPALQRRGLRGTFFIVTGFVGKPGYLTWDGVGALAQAGMELGSHSVDHERLPDLSPARAAEELAASKRELEARLQKPVEVLAYPFNSVRGGLQAAARQAGYRAAVAGVVHGSRDLFALYRVSVDRRTTLEQFARAVAAGAAPASR